VGVLLAQISGFPLQVAPSLAAAGLVAGGQYVLLARLFWGREVIGGLALGLMPAYVGYYVQALHWASELLILGLLLSLAGLNALLAQRWCREWRVIETGSPDQPVGGAPRALIFTLVNLLVIGGLLLIWYFPASPWPGRWGAWVLVGLAVANQELIKRKFYNGERGSKILAWAATALAAGLNLWLLVIFYYRGQA
jgi:hypothetical protein